MPLKKTTAPISCYPNMTTIFIVIIGIAVVYLFFAINKQPIQIHNNIKEESHSQFGAGAGTGFGTGFMGYMGGVGVGVRPNYGYSNLPNDVLMNPYVPPLKDERYLLPSVAYVPAGAIPINVSTNVGAVDTEFRQVGILTPTNNSPNKILSLMGRPLFTSRDKWQFYTMTKNNVKLPIIKNGRSGTNEYGCDNIYDKDVVYVEGYGEPFKATMYDNNVIKYLPFI